MKWHDVREELPSKNGWYLCYCRSGAITELHWSVKHEAFNAVDSLLDADDEIKVSHWVTMEELNLPKRLEDEEDEVQNG